MGRSQLHPYLSRRDNKKRKLKIREAHPLMRRRLRSQRRRKESGVKAQQIPHEAALMESKLQRMKDERTEERRRQVIENALNKKMNEDPEICSEEKRHRTYESTKGTKNTKPK